VNSKWPTCLCWYHLKYISFFILWITTEYKKNLDTQFMWNSVNF